MAAYLHCPVSFAAIERDLAGRLRLRPCPNIRTLLDGRWTSGTAGVLLDLTDPAGSPSVPLVGALRQRWPGLPLVGVAGVSHGDTRTLAAAVRAGLTDVLVLGVDDPWTVLAPFARPTRAAAAVAHVLRMLPQRVPLAALAMVHHCVGSAIRGVTTADLARESGVVRRTLLRRCSSLSVPSPSELLTWGRILVASRMLEDPSFSVERVALEIGYSSALTLRRALRNHTSLTPSEVRQRGGLASVFPIFLDRLSRAASCAHYVATIHTAAS